MLLLIPQAHHDGGRPVEMVREVISITSTMFMERAHSLYKSLGFRRAPERDWYVPGEDMLLWVFRLEL
ncbi:hypothetical protein [Pseudarthrobacter sp. NS4]|uniref:hypothetical protein n=1 Tax=Pseudarthrobacter sp. NS4 TaxID=2973976 RepID=UPI0021622E4B|nr:hypothetical protein [Pseudarthrobacter sp. NS4]